MADAPVAQVVLFSGCRLNVRAGPNRSTSHASTQPEVRMDVTVSCRHIDLSLEQRKLVQRKIAKLATGQMQTHVAGGGVEMLGGALRIAGGVDRTLPSSLT
jgi:hypothetical protein